MKRIRDRVRIEISPDGLQATALAVRRMPRSGASVKALRAILEARGVTHGVRAEALEHFVAAWRRGDRRPVVVATGDPAIPAGADELCRVHPPARSGRDPIELLPLFVAAGETVFAVRTARAAKTGCTVTGASIPAPRSSGPTLPTAGSGFQVVGRLWQASHDGFLEHADGEIRVSEDLIHKYDLPAGEYHWTGGARIDGSLCDGVRLEVDGSATILGEVGRGARLRVGGDATIEGAVRGDGRTRIEVDGKLECSAVSGAFLYASGDVRVRTLCETSTVRTCGSFLNELAGGLVSSSRIDAVRGVCLNDVVPGSGLPSAIHVGTSEWLDEEWQAVEAEVQRWSRHYSHLFDQFRERFAGVIDRRSEIYRLAPGPRREYEREYERVVAEQQRVDRQISRLRSRQTMLLESRCRDETAVVQVHGEATTGVLFSIRRVPLVAGSEGLQAVVLTLSPRRNRVIAIPRSIYESSLADGEPIDAPLIDPPSEPPSEPEKPPVIGEIVS